MDSPGAVPRREHALNGLCTSLVAILQKLPEVGLKLSILWKICQGSGFQFQDITDPYWLREQSGQTFTVILLTTIQKHSRNNLQTPGIQTSMMHSH